MPDWQKIVLDLRGIVGSCRQLARLMHYRNPDYLTKLSRAEIDDPRYSVGVELVEMYRKYVKEEIPLVGAMQQRALIK